MDGQPRRREAERADLDGLLGQLPHLGQVLGGGRLAVGAALAHHVDPQRRVRQVSGHVDVPLARFEGIHVLREGLPVPRQAVGHHDTGMSSTPAITSTSTSWSSWRHGAKPTPQLPITTVVTPCADDGVNRSDQIDWPS